MKNFKPKAWMLPQPVLIIGTDDKEGKPNAMNAAWAGQWDYNEIFISLGSHATTENLNNCPDFTVAFATTETMVAADYVGIVSAKNVPQKLNETKWSIQKSANINAPIFTDFPMTIECRIKEKLKESATGFYLIAEIINIVANDDYISEDGKPNVEKMNLITFDPVHNKYIELGKAVGNAFSDGKKLEKL